MSDPIHPIALLQPPFAGHLGLKVVSATPEKVVAELVATPELINRNGVLHGGAIMAVADNMGGTAAFLNIAEGEGTTTVESKTNFFRAVPAGETVTVTTVPLHIGRTTHVWQTTLTLPNGKVAAMVTQTQLTLRGGKLGR